MAKLHFYYSSMNAGKTTILLQSAYNYQERGMNVLLFTASIDDRYQTGQITSRIGLEAEAICFDATTNFFNITQNTQKKQAIHCILIDEAQFLSKGQVLQLTDVADQLNIPVLTYGLRTDFQGEPFEGSQYLLSWAETLIEIKTVCHCGKKATYVLRMNAEGQVVTSGDQIEIGGNDKYISVCRKHFKAKQTTSAKEKEHHGTHSAS